MFDLLAATAGAGETDPADAPVAECDPDEPLLPEKEVLGFYLSGHPLRRVWDHAVRLGAVGMSQLGHVADGARVVVCGLVGALREINTKNGNRMGFATVEDVEGTVEVTVFPELFRQSVSHLRAGAPLLIRGRVEGTSTTRKLLAEDIRPLGPDGEGGTGSAGHCRVRVGAAAPVSDPLAALREICDAHPGPAPLSLHLEVDGTEVVVRSRTVCVRPSPAFRTAVEALFGSGSVALEA
jgi:DNA polymerase-3 subunit alpha